MDEGAESKVLARIITSAHFMHALNEVTPSSSEGSHFELRRWHKKHELKRTSDNSAKPHLTGTASVATAGTSVSRAGEYGGKNGGKSGYDWQH